MARRKPPQVHGLLVIDKPAGMTSHDVVDRVRKRLGERRVGHAGTLDPDATGVLLVGVGNATRLMRFMDLVEMDGRMISRKSYTGTVVLGIETSTLDAAGEVTATHDMTSVFDRLAKPDGVEFVQSIVDANLLGAIMQIPPMVSAIRVDGKRLHELAREGVEVEREPRPVTVFSFAVTGVAGDTIDIDVTCSSGTFIRTLAADLGRLLGGGAHLRSLRRTSVGAFTIHEAAGIDDAPLRPTEDAVRGLAALRVAGERAVELRAGAATGKILPVSTFASCGPEPWALFTEDGSADGRLVAVYESFSNERVGSGMARPAVSLASAT
ncbi:MAG: tRNA pseudouridine(55) synthase TruB [Acidimicrobiales bacterium mtb01]|nr:tRNA pseudouridine(55) synthase TruB [Actinomycetota bacterium]TEX44844.1 MAG: tRNA pseudouridine(55) synthase TruB [Acidimicrobiales bacterium mtb01]